MAEDKMKIEDKKEVPDNTDYQFEDTVCSAEFGEGCKIPEEKEDEKK